MTSNHTTTRRTFVKNSLIAGAIAAYPSILFGKEKHKLDFPVVDLHVHLTDWFTIDKALELAEKRNIEIGIVEHPGEHYAIKTDKDLQKYIEKLRKYPVYVGLQPVYTDWSKDFSQEVMDQLDYVLMDALTIPIPGSNGHWERIWRIDTFVGDKDMFMDQYMDFNEYILTKEPIDIFAWPTFLPTAIARHYDELWTEKRMQKIIDLAKKKNIAIEINEIAHVPNDRFIHLAKEAGLKFTFGTDARNYNAARFQYCYEMAESCGLTEDDMYYPLKKA